MIVMCLLGLVPDSAQAQKTLQDSLQVGIPSDSATDDTHRLKLKQAIVSTALFGTSALFVSNGWLTKQRENVQDVLSAKGKHKIKVDEYLQYSPMVAVYGLNLAGVKGKHNLKDRTILLAMSYATMGILVNTMKFSFKERRPDSHARNSFPSGHTATVFMGAEYLNKEYKDVCPWIGYLGYATAAATGYMRIYNNRHYLNDVIAGACVGVMSTKLAYWLYPKIFSKSKCKQDMTMIGLPYYSDGKAGFNMCMFF